MENDVWRMLARVKRGEHSQTRGAYARTRRQAWRT